MTYKQIEASREARLWLGQIIIPTFTLVATMMMVPEIRAGVVNTATKVKDKIKTKFKK